MCIAAGLALTAGTTTASHAIDSPASAAQTRGEFEVAVVDWLDRAAKSYQAEIVDKLMVPRAGAGSTGPGPAASREKTPPSGGLAGLRTALAAALHYVWDLLGRTGTFVGLPIVGAEGSFLVASADQAARDAKAYIDARRKAEEQWRKAIERAEEAAREAARNAAREQKRSSMTGLSGSAEQKRAEERKAYLEKLKQDLDRRIAEGLKKLEALEKESAAKKAEEARALAEEAERNAAEALRAAEEQQRAAAAAEEALKRAEEIRKAEQAEIDAKRAADAEAERKSREDEAARQAEKDKVEQDTRDAEARAEADRKAREEAARLAEVARKKAIEEEARSAAEAAEAEQERRNAEARKAEQEKADRDRIEREQAREARASASGQIADVRAAYERRLAQSAPKPEARTAPSSPPSPSSERPTAESPANDGAAAEIDIPRIPAADDEDASPQTESVKLGAAEPRRKVVTKHQSRRHAAKPRKTKWRHARRVSRNGTRVYAARYRASERPLQRCRRKWLSRHDD